MPGRKRKPRKLLVATLGLATLTIGQGCLTSGNLVAPPPTDAGIRRDASTDASTDSGSADATPQDGD